MKRLLLLLLSFVLLLAACGTSEQEAPAAEPAAESDTETVTETVAEEPAVASGELTVTNVLANMTLPSDTGSFWMTITNGTDTADALIGAEVDGCGVIELHDMIMEDDVMVMQEVEGGEILIPAGETVELQRGGLHVMCIQKEAPLEAGSELGLTLLFANAGAIEVTADVVAPDGMGMDMDHGDMDHNHDEMDDEEEMDHDHDHGDDEEEMDHDHDDEHEAVELGDAAQQLQIATATYLLDNAGFHAMDVRFNGEEDEESDKVMGEVMPEDAAVVTHITNVLQRAEWPEALQEEVDELVAVLADYTAALEAGNAEAAAPLAAEAHTLQHDLSHAVEAALEHATHGEEHDEEMEEGDDHDMAHDMAMLLDPEGAMFPVAVAQTAMDAAGFHGMDERFNEEEGDIMPNDALTAQRVAALVADTAWPEALQAQADEFVTLLTDFAAALEADDTEAAAPLAAEVHTLQHDLSAEITTWLGFESDHDH